MAKESNKKKKKSGGWLVWIFILCLGMLANETERFDFSGIRRLWWQFRVTLLRHGIRVEPVFLIAAAIILVALILVLISAAARRSRDVREDKRPATGRTSAAIQRPDPRSRSFTPPEPSCIVCDHTGEDHFEHDKQQRIAQLNEWLKNGLIDREEYKVLKARYERNL